MRVVLVFFSCINSLKQNGFTQFKDLTANATSFLWVVRSGLCYVKSVRIQSFSGPYFSAFGLNTERYGVRSIFPHSVKMRENTDQKNSEYGHFSCSASSRYTIQRLTIQRCTILAWIKQTCLLCIEIIRTITGRENITMIFKDMVCKESMPDQRSPTF